MGINLYIFHLYPLHSTQIVLLHNNTNKISFWLQTINDDCDDDAAAAAVAADDVILAMSCHSLVSEARDNLWTQIGS